MGVVNTWYVIDKEKHTCTPSPELIGVIIGGSLGYYIRVYGSSKYLVCD